MKLLFIGEGRHDIGDPGPHPAQPRPAQGAIPALARRVCPKIAPESVALSWTEIHRFNPAAKRSGYGAKIAAAALLAERNFACAGIMVVTDKDGDNDRQTQLLEGVDRATKLFPKCRIASGLAVQSIEAWTLAVPDKIAEELGLDVGIVQDQYPPGVEVEAMAERSGKPDHRPKRLLQRIAQLKHGDDTTQFREAVAARTDVEVLARTCPQGFAPFAQQLRNTFGQPA